MPKTLSGIETANQPIIDLLLNSKFQAGKCLKPYQGLKQIDTDTRHVCAIAPENA